MPARFLQEPDGGAIEKGGDDAIQFRADDGGHIKGRGVGIEAVLQARQSQFHLEGLILFSFFSALVSRIGTRPVLAAFTKCLFCHKTS